MTGWVLCGDALEVMARLPDNSVEAVVTDPPYGLRFMGKQWDHGVPGAAFWCEALRVAKPGARLLAMGGTRTFHRLVCAIEDAGWRVMDTLCWMYGSGFPKSHDISKAIDREAGAERKVGEFKFKGGTQLGVMNDDAWQPKDVYDSTPATEAARKWDGWGTALKPAREDICLAMKPLDGTYAQNTLRHGCGGINVDGCRIGTNAGWAYPHGPGGLYSKKYQQESPIAKDWNAFSTKADNKPSASTQGRWPANVILSHTPECKRVGTRKVKNKGGKPNRDTERSDSLFQPTSKHFTSDIHHFNPDGTETVEAWECHPDCPVRMLDMQSGAVGGGARNPETCAAGDEIVSVARGTFSRRTYDGNTYGDTGGASRFFYCAKASRAERNAGLEGLPQGEVDRYGECGATEAHAPRRTRIEQNRHPTVKPLALMRWLVRLVTPPGGTVLDPFCGSGTTGIAAHQEGMHYILIDNDPESCDIARRRIAHWLC